MAVNTETYTLVEMQDEGKSQRLPFVVLFCAVLVVLACGTLLFALNMRRGLNHDEHQFVAGGMLAALGLQPYRDFAWFHLPGLAWLYALLFQWDDRLLLTARLLSIVAATGTMALLMVVALRLRNLGVWTRLGVGVLTLLLLLATPGFWFAAGRAWNHDVATFLAMAAFLLMVAGLERARAASGGMWLIGAAGLLLGAAASVRLTVAPLALAFVAAPFCWALQRGNKRRLWRTLVALIVGGAIGALPVWGALLRDPQAFLFGNLRYAGLNTDWYALQGADISLATKVRMVFLLLVQPGNLLLLGLTAIAIVRAWGAIRAAARAPEVAFWLIGLPLIMLGAVAPTPVQGQYLFALFPYAALGMLLALRHAAPPRWFLLALAASAALAAILAGPRYGEGLAVLPVPAEWYPVKLHARGEFMASMMAAQATPRTDDWAFTLSPIVPLEGGLPIDARTATGPFAWRVADLVTPDERARFGLLGAEEIDAALAENGPRALLTAMHSDDEAEDDAALESWARAHDYVNLTMPDEGTLWLSPLAHWGDIRLGAQTFPTQTVAGGEVAGTLYLQSSAPTSQNLNLLLRAVDFHGNELFRFDGWPFGSATSTWETDALWQDGHAFAIPADAAPGNYRIEASFYDPATFETLGDVERIGWITTMPELASEMAENIRSNSNSEAEIMFGDEFELSQASSAAVSAHAGETIDFALTWKRRHDSLQSESIDYVRSAHLIDAGGNLVAQLDQPPLQGFYPTSAWRTGDLVFDTLSLALPSDLAPGQYQLKIGLYDAASMHSLGDAVVAEVNVIE